VPPPAPTVVAPFPILRVLKGLADWVEQAAGLQGQDAVLWGDRRAIRPGLPYIGLRLVSGPTPRGLAGRWRVVQAIESAQIDVTAAVGEATSLRVGYVEARRVRQAGESLGDHRDALVSLLDRDAHQDSWTAAAQGATEVLLTPDHIGALRVVEAHLGATRALVTTRRREQAQSYQLRVTATCYGVRGTQPPPGADDVSSWVARLLSAADDEDLEPVLRSYGITLGSRAYETRNLGQPSGPEWEARAGVDLFVDVVGHRFRAVKPALAAVALDSASAVGDAVLVSQFDVPEDLPQQA
jgi:hypothetical protein